MENNKNGVTINLGCFTTLFFIFLVLKLCSVITWSWWWVTAPIWIPTSIGLVALMIALFLIYKNCK